MANLHRRRPPLTGLVRLSLPRQHFGFDTQKNYIFVLSILRMLLFLRILSMLFIHQGRESASDVMEIVQAGAFCMP